MAQFMPKLETAHNFTSYCLFNIIKVDSYDSDNYSKKCERVIHVYEILNLSTQKYFSKNVNHLNLFFLLFV